MLGVLLLCVCCVVDVCDVMLIEVVVDDVRCNVMSDVIVSGLVVCTVVDVDVIVGNVCVL